MRRLTLDDEYMMLIHTPKTPMQIGALQYYEVPEGRRGHFADDVIAHLERRLPATGLLCVRRHAPLGFDTDVWIDRHSADLSRHVTIAATTEPPNRDQLTEMVAGWVALPLDPDQPPFRIMIVEQTADGAGALFVAIHHAFADGIGFQHVLGILTDPTPDDVVSEIPRRRDERAPIAPWWLARSAARFGHEALTRRRHRDERSAVAAEIQDFKADPAHRRPKTPRFELSGPTSDARSYATVSLPLERLQAIARNLGGSVNDAFLATGSGTVRRYLLERDLLPGAPLVALAARSYRRPEHGPLGNRIVSLQPHLATDVDDPGARFEAIRASMAVELARSRLHERQIDHDDRPFGARRRAARYRARQAGGDAVLPGNLTLSNVPGPAEPRYLAGYLQTANYPAPILGSGRFLNMTLRRYRDALDVGVMTDAVKIPDARALLPHLHAAVDELEGVETPRRSASG